MTSTSIRGTPLIILIVVMALSLGACGHGKGEQMKTDPDLADGAARQQIYDYLAKTLEGLPDGTFWSFTSDAGRPSLAAGGTLVCSDDDGATPEDTPVDVQVTYWLNGVPAGQEADTFAALQKVWAGWGWRRLWRQRGAAAYVKADDPDGYVLVAHDAGNGPGSVSVTAGSPCFWSKHDREVDPPLQKAQPKQIHRPDATG